MMPLSFNLTLMNPVSLHSQVLSTFHDLSTTSTIPDSSLLADCLTLEVAS